MRPFPQPWRKKGYPFLATLPTSLLGEAVRSFPFRRMRRFSVHSRLRSRVLCPSCVARGSQRPLVWKGAWLLLFLCARCRFARPSLDLRGPVSIINVWQCENFPSPGGIDIVHWTIWTTSRRGLGSLGAWVLFLVSSMAMKCPSYSFSGRL